MCHETAATLATLAAYSIDSRRDGLAAAKGSVAVTG